MKKVLRIGTRDSQLAVWQATLVQNLLKERDVASELIYIKSEGDLDTVTPLYQLGVQGIFTKTLDAALLNNRIDVAVHSMKDVPTQLAGGIRQAAVLSRASYKDIFVYKNEDDLKELEIGNWGDTNPDSKFLTANASFIIATSSIRRKAQWLNRYPTHTFDNLRGNVNTRLRKVAESHWNGAIFAAAGLERIHLRPQKSIDLDWMLPAPAQGAIMIVCREDDSFAYESCHSFNDPVTALCTKIERDFLRTLMGGCSTPISALAVMEYAQIIFKGNICSADGHEKREIKKVASISDSNDLGIRAAQEILAQGGQNLVEGIRKKEGFADGNL
jgi:hydroxymethylbilane synthase